MNELICMGYCPSMRSRWLDIGQVLFFFARAWIMAESRFINMLKRTRSIWSELHASPHIHIWIKTFHIWIYG